MPDITFTANCGRREIKLLWCGGWAVLIVALMCAAAAVAGRNNSTQAHQTLTDRTAEWYNLRVTDGKYAIGAYETCLEEPGNKTCASARGW